MNKTLVIVGNGPLNRDLSAQVDGADLVLRFNEPRVSIGMSGSKTDMLMLATSSKQMQQWISDPAFVNSEIVRNTPEILFAFHPSIIKRFHHHPNFLSRLKGRRADWTVQAIDYFGQAGKKIRIMPAQFYFDVCEELGIGSERMKEMFPSTGFFGIWLVLRKYSQPHWDIKICGFSWEGWKRHDWAAERQWIEARIKEGKLQILE
ncbi:glycosyltransferase family 29 protein [Falsochrobactrum sp. TDYN1]|uniref:Glycosyltransferase family 29 protein n=1 Tax=Falsochrobactrum tianjinense TaxID=2706015 RepID=A0A949PK25_9HYPH|nr:glycosyltransferase family 29 protein [Falsochrobactrum sp. TDYN1]MBV2142447.1 glycosyltransferase family 29 protein [Falsochrobactrum sp. TDYN1]